jgi:hypothetical protein
MIIAIAFYVFKVISQRRLRRYYLIIFSQNIVNHEYFRLNSSKEGSTDNTSVLDREINN